MISSIKRSHCDCGNKDTFPATNPVVETRQIAKKMKIVNIYQLYYNTIHFIQLNSE